MSKKYTLTRKNSVVGPIDPKTKKAKYSHNRGDVIDESEYKELVKRHQDQFEAGVKELNKKASGKDVAQNEAIEELTERVERLEALVDSLAENLSKPETESKDEDKGDKKPKK
ncbi:MAG: hypothetical protein ABJI69_00280 [Balneola sp.]